MTRFFFALALAFALLRAASAQTTPADLADVWHTGDGLGFNLDLTLSEACTYEVNWRGCLGIYGSTEGTWSIVDETVRFTVPEEADSIFKDHLTVMDIVSHEGQRLLIDEDHREEFAEHGAIRYYCYTNRAARQALWNSHW